MAVHHGKNGKVKFGSNAVAEITGWTIEESVDTVDTTAMEDTAKTFLAGITSWNGSIQGNHDPADTNGQVAANPGSTVTLGLYSDGDAATKKYFSGSAIITGRTRSGSMSDKVTFGFTFQGTGALTVATAS